MKQVRKRGVSMDDSTDINYICVLDRNQHSVHLGSQCDAVP